MLFFNFIILLLDPDPDPDPAGSEKVGSVTSLVQMFDTALITYKIFIVKNHN